MGKSHIDVECTQQIDKQNKLITTCINFVKHSYLRCMHKTTKYKRLHSVLKWRGYLFSSIFADIGKESNLWLKSSIRLSFTFLFRKSKWSSSRCRSWNLETIFQLKNTDTLDCCFFSLTRNLTEPAQYEKKIKCNKKRWCKEQLVQFLWQMNRHLEVRQRH